VESNALPFGTQDTTQQRGRSERMEGGELLVEIYEVTC